MLISTLKIENGILKAQVDALKMEKCEALESVVRFVMSMGSMRGVNENGAVREGGDGDESESGSGNGNGGDNWVLGPMGWRLADGLFFG